MFPTWLRRHGVSIGLAVLALLIIDYYAPTLAAIWHWLSKVLYPFFLAVILTYILHPIVNLMARRKVPRSIAVLLIYGAFFMSIAVLIVNLAPRFMDQLAELNAHMPKLTMQAEQYKLQIQQARHLPDPIRMGMQQAFRELEQYLQRIASNSVSTVRATLNLFFLFMIIPFLVFYMLKDYKVFGRTFIGLFPQTWRIPTYRLFLDIDRALGNYIRGQLIVGTVVGVLAYIAYWWLDLPYPLLLASIVALFNIIPYIGPFFGAAPAVLVASTISLKLALIVAGLNTAIQVLEGNVISPQVVGKSMHMHPLAVMLALLVGGELAGILGLILAVPMFAILRVISTHAIRHWRRLRH